MKLPFLVIIALLAGCASTHTTPPPGDEFTAEGHHNNPAGSVEYARRHAAKFCANWNAAPGILTTETIDLRTEANPGQAGKEMASRVMTTGKLFKKDLHFKTTITYKCY